MAPAILLCVYHFFFFWNFKFSLYVYQQKNYDNFRFIYPKDAWILETTTANQSIKQAKKTHYQ